MSLDLLRLIKQDFTAAPLFIRTPQQLNSERAAFRDKQSQNKNFELITKIYDCIRCIRDPERPYTLEQLDVVNEKDIEVEEKSGKRYVTIFWKPPQPICPYSVHIGLSILLKIEREIEESKSIKFKIIGKGLNDKVKHAIDKQLNDKERLDSAKENEAVMIFVESLIN